VEEEGESEETLRVSKASDSTIQVKGKKGRDVEIKLG